MAGSVPVVRRSTVDRDLPAMRLKALLDPQRIGRTGGHRPRRTVRRRPLDLLGRWAMTGVEEARRPSLRRWLAVEQRLGVRHRVPAFLERLADRSQILGTP